MIQDIVAKVIESVANIHSFLKTFAPCIVYHKIASRAQLVAEPMIFKMFMKRKIDAYVL